MTDWITGDPLVLLTIAREYTETEEEAARLVERAFRVICEDPDRIGSDVEESLRALLRMLSAE